jgi:hypothetical protein
MSALLMTETLENKGKKCKAHLGGVLRSIFFIFWVYLYPMDILKESVAALYG